MGELLDSSSLCLTGASMASSAINAGALVTLQELNSASPHVEQGASLRVTGKAARLFCRDCTCCNHRWKCLPQN
ncbi:unnamed protein product [Camellia sinensis]